MMSAHTPGPWKFVTKWCDQVTSNDGCICIPTEYNSNGVSRTKLESRANARLIAAAPDLLEAANDGTECAEILRNLMDNIKVHGNYSVESTLTYLRQAHGCLSKLPAAIAKATGAAS